MSPCARCGCPVADLTAAREALAEYDRPRCEALLGVDRPTGSVTYQCCRAAGHDESISHDFGPRFTGVHVELLRAALAEVDRLTAALAEARAELVNEHGKGDGHCPDCGRVHDIEACPKCGADIQLGYGLMFGGMGEYKFCENDACDWFWKREDRDDG